MRIRYLTMFAVGILALAVGVQLPAKDKNEAPPKIYSDLQACRGIVDDKARLACFDLASAAMAKDVDANDLVLLDRSTVRKTKRSLFGFSMPDIDFLRDGDGTEFTKLETTIESVSDLGHGKWQFRVPEGSIWMTTEPSSHPLKSGQKVVISKGSLGGFFVKVGNKRGVRAKRVG